MLIVISPAKKLDLDSPARAPTATQPVFLDDAKILVDELRYLDPAGISALMGISEKLGELNFERYLEWQPPFTKSNAKPALLAFKGDVYTGMDAESFSADDFKFAQQHLRILSGLYGVLRPLDLMKAYRLEMGTKFSNPRGNNLYQFWGDTISITLNKQLKSLKTGTLVNLASNEYFKAVNKSILNADIISPAFKDLKGGKYKIISFYAKKARGMMTSWIIRNAITDVKQLKKFKQDGYRYNAGLSTTKNPVFTRDAAPGR
jgi:cytoplasmic iron level regulating protein YaaA (DUF328/UPF0246 family)